MRAELLASKKNYRDEWFLPIESNNELKDTVAEAKEYFTEYRLSPFNADQVRQYIYSHIALEMREVVERCRGDLFSSRAQSRGRITSDALRRRLVRAGFGSAESELVDQLISLIMVVTTAAADDADEPSGPEAMWLRADVLRGAAELWRSWVESMEG